MITDADRLAARAELLTLRATLPEGVQVRRDQVRVAPGTDPLAEAEAEDMLAARPKPLHCRPSVEEGLLTVSAAPATADWARALEVSSAMAAHDPSMRALQNPEAIILLKGRDESLRLPSAAYQAWRRDYMLPDHCSLGGYQPTEADQSNGITYVWTVGRVEPLVDAHYLAAEASVLCERCGSRLAIALFRNRDLDPPVKLLLCSECLATENGRKLVSLLNSAAATPPYPGPMSDDDLRYFFKNFRIEPPDDLQ